MRLEFEVLWYLPLFCTVEVSNVLRFHAVGGSRTHTVLILSQMSPRHLDYDGSNILGGDICFSFQVFTCGVIIHTKNFTYRNITCFVDHVK